MTSSHPGIFSPNESVIPVLTKSGGSITPMRPPSAVQRGSVLFLSMEPGDPSTPGGVASTATAKRITRAEMKNVPKIPSLPISYREAEKILRQMGGQRVPDDWQGGLPFSYHVGPGLAAVAMQVQMSEGLKPIYDVVAKIPGTTDEIVVVGKDRKSTRLNSSHVSESRMPSSA